MANENILFFNFMEIFYVSKMAILKCPSVMSRRDTFSQAIKIDFLSGNEAGQDQKWKNKRDNESGGNHKESTGKKVEVVWACDAKRGTLRRKEGNGNESTGEKEERKT